MHDPTEGGLATGLAELATAANAGLEVDTDAIRVLPETRAVCDALGLDPSGAARLRRAAGRLCARPCRRRARRSRRRGHRRLGHRRRDRGLGGPPPADAGRPSRPAKLPPRRARPLPESGRPDAAAHPVGGPAAGAGGLRRPRAGRVRRLLGSRHHPPRRRPVADHRRLPASAWRRSSSCPSAWRSSGARCGR